MLRNIFTRQERLALFFIIGIGFLGIGIRELGAAFLPAPVYVEPSKVPINRATAEELAALPGIGPVMARRIIQERTEHGFFLTARDLRRVKGMTGKLAQRLSGYLRFD